jgi:predicted Rossmann fold nucleotide-binding protein DprA/Smf involved in DNA uptake
METTNLHMLGNEALLGLSKTAFLCSRSLPAAAVWKAYEWAEQMRRQGRCVIGGFHSAIEQDVLRLLLKGEQPVVIALARGMKKQWPPEVQTALAAGRMLILSPFSESVRRANSATAMQRNRLMCELAEEIAVAHARVGGQLEGLLQEIEGKKPVEYI